MQKYFHTQRIEIVEIAFWLFASSMVIGEIVQSLNSSFAPASSLESSKYKYATYQVQDTVGRISVNLRFFWAMFVDSKNLNWNIDTGGLGNQLDAVIVNLILMTAILRAITWVTNASNINIQVGEYVRACVCVWVWVWVWV
jgi:hypothetical protein